MQTIFYGYNTNEIGDVKWASIDEILSDSSKYSRQAVAVAEALLNYIG
jgi:hypothetical protein